MKKLMTLILISLITLSAVISFGATKFASSATSAQESMDFYGSPPSTVSKTVMADTYIVVPSVPSIANFSPLVLYPNATASQKAVATSVTRLNPTNSVLTTDINSELRASRPFT